MFRLRNVSLFGLLLSFNLGCGVAQVETAVASPEDEELDSSGSLEVNQKLPSCASYSEKCQGPSCEPKWLLSEPDRFIESIKSHGRYLFYLSCASRHDTGYHEIDLCELKRFNKRNGAIKTLAPNLGTVLGGLAVNSSSVYFVGKCSWDTGCKLFKYSRRNGSLEVLVNEKIWTNTNVRVDSKHVYWTDYEGAYIARIPLNGGEVEKFISEANSDRESPEGLPGILVEIHGDTVFQATRTLRKISKAGTGRTELLYDSKEHDSFNTVAVDDDFIYTQQDRWISNQLTMKTVAKTPIAGGATTTIFEDPRNYNNYDFPGMMADGQGNLVWTMEQESERVIKMFIGNSNRVIELARGLKSELGYGNIFENTALDSQNAYFFSSIPETRAEHKQRCGDQVYDCLSPGAIYAVPLCQP